LGWNQSTFEKSEIFSTQPGSNSWWAGLVHINNPTQSLKNIIKQCKFVIDIEKHFLNKKFRKTIWKITELTKKIEKWVGIAH